MLKRILIGSLCASTMLLAQSGAGINVNENDVEIEATVDSRNIAALQTSSTIYLADFNFINIEDSSNDKKLKLFGAGVGATNKLEGLEGVELTFGAKFIISNIDNRNYDEWHMALPLMGIVRYTFPPLMFNIPPVSIESKLLYAPGALSFGDSERYSEFRVAADIEMIENVRIYAGYRNIVTGFKADDGFLFSNGFYAGMKFTY